MNAQKTAAKRYSVAEIAEALGVSKNAVQRRANKERWKYEEASTRGGWRRLYADADLPRAIARKLAVRAAVGAVKATKQELESLYVVFGDEVFEVRRLAK